MVVKLGCNIFMQVISIQWTINICIHAKTITVQLTVSDISTGVIMLSSLHDRGKIQVHANLISTKFISIIINI